MFCKIACNQVSPKDIDQLTKVIEEQRNPLLSRQEGFKGVYYMTKPNGEFLIMTCFETEAQMEAWSNNPEHKNLGAQLAPLFMSSSVTDTYKVQSTIVI